MHFLGQRTITALTAGRGVGETYCLAHHLTVSGGQRQLMIAALRYEDTFVKQGAAWLFAERRLYVDWMEKRTLS
jgi:SnoaL-like domain